MLVKEPAWEDAYTEQERNLCKALKNGPLMLGEAADAAWESKKITGLSEKNHKNICKKFRLKGIYLYFAYYAI